MGFAKLRYLTGLSALALTMTACETVPTSNKAVDNNQVAASDNKHQSDKWSYIGESGPNYWGGLRPEYSQCDAGDQQSPINIANTIAADISSSIINWSPFIPTIVNNGHTIEVKSPTGNTVILDGKSFELVQFHFHHTSEHTINDHQYPMEAHFVHKADDGKLAVLAVLFAEDQANQQLTEIWGASPAVIGEITANFTLDPNQLLPVDRQHYRYQGSLTTPPCSQIVSWVVFKQKLTISAKQIAAFSTVFGENVRPVQNTNRRYITRSR
ncbi:MAG: carbonic anhydrase family protein [Robiginitomaculum sp.]|nr:carbonic anhydrase family protein [Robiginitomaculum sp.]